MRLKGSRQIKQEEKLFKLGPPLSQIYQKGGWMLKEIKHISQIPGEKKRRWFTSKYFDLFVFYENGEIVEFQLSYNKSENEKIILWSKKEGFSHQGVDQGEHPGKVKRSPIIVPDGIFQKTLVLEKFIKESQDIDRDVANFVIQKLELC